MLRNNIFIIMLSALLFSCAEEYTPKPKAYPRIDLPAAEYKDFISDCPFTIQHNEKSFVLRANDKNPCWLNIDYPFLRCRIHMSYVPVEGNLNQLMEDARTLVYKHTVKASAINERDVVRDDENVYGRIYEIDGDAASSVQFFATDSNNHFLRGALYFNAASNSDSLQPAIDYVREDVERMMNSLTWSN